MLERAAVTDRVKIEDVLSAFMDTTLRSLPISMGFQQADRWTICVYRASLNPQTDRYDLICVAHNRAIKCNASEARPWSEGIGVSGISYSNRSEIIVPNLQSASLGSMFNLAAGARDYDDERYRSIVSVPVKVDGQDRPWGVVVATSDRVDHFTPDDETGLKTTEPVRSLAGMVALAAAMCDRSHDHAY
ncbi:GAF domain-containing protein [Sphingomonas sp.]|uniref:GAF domain-containing protein n=1 Tax=Sphingomonas sp. TaxID=28214 RepID=UPI002EDA1ED0